ncbi:type 4 prepilin-like proteins leader peptide-processing enzyme [Arenicella chitinivorans]|uniref:Prepilin leader peptidase/N-methyltransferase n=1 Tax=Arenicella chitinivorans TaxID=1329800 RepID=A0A918RMU4_9GAMM|nr:A24 family peptidase [Arenicella chitinivorans]GHA05978.1 type 4 prepilin-like proteins leader peptide-processing enzyme [Arenicella chitinivorans]
MLEQLSTLPNGALASLGMLFGLLIGSFLNVVIFRYPNMMMHQWTVQSKEWLELPVDDTDPPTLMKPASHCSQCKTPIKAWHNIPLISYLLLRGKCASCGAQFGLRYPLVELLTGVLTAIVVYQLGWSLQTVFAVLLTWVLVALAFIDIDHKLLPDDIVLPTLWLGLAMSLWPVFADTRSAIIGAIAGYLVFWIVFQVFLRVTGKEGMGFGDFKLMAMLGAWLGWQYLPQMILVSTVLGSVFGVTFMIIKKASSKLEIPFGPYIAVAGWVAMLWGEEINRAYLNLTGF